MHKAELHNTCSCAQVTRSMEARTEAQAALEAAEGSVSAAQREVAGAEAGDGRDESNRSLQVGGWVVCRFLTLNGCVDIAQGQRGPSAGFIVWHSWSRAWSMACYANSLQLEVSGHMGQEGQPLVTLAGWLAHVQQTLQYTICCRGVVLTITSEYVFWTGESLANGAADTPVYNLHAGAACRCPDRSHPCRQRGKSSRCARKAPGQAACRATK
eukprot:1142629-Pelagomonas_calceolata.AAC.1